MSDLQEQRTYEIVCQTDDDKEVTVTIAGTRADFDKDSARLTIFHGETPVGGFVRILRWYRKNS